MYFIHLTGREKTEMSKENMQFCITLLWILHYSSCYVWFCNLLDLQEVSGPWDLQKGDQGAKFIYTINHFLLCNFSIESVCTGLQISGFKLIKSCCFVVFKNCLIILSIYLFVFPELSLIEKVSLRGTEELV